MKNLQSYLACEIKEGAKLLWIHYKSDTAFLKQYKNLIKYLNLEGYIASALELEFPINQIS